MLHSYDAVIDGRTKSDDMKSINLNDACAKSDDVMHIFVTVINARAYDEMKSISEIDARAKPDDVMRIYGKGRRKGKKRQKSSSSVHEKRDSRWAEAQEAQKG